MHIGTMQNSIQNVLQVGRDRDESINSMTRQILMIILVELWTHTKGEHLGWEDLTDSEFRACVMWVSFSKKAYMDTQIRMIKDMREVFPGLSLLAARDFVRGY